MDWVYGGKPLHEAPEGFVGFVYLITEIESGKKYVGKKLFWGMRKVKGRRKKTESNWREYFGSSKALQDRLEVLGPEGYHREILHLCKSKGDMTFLEMREQFQRDVLFREDYYNEFMGGRLHSKHLKGVREDYNDRNATSS